MKTDNWEVDEDKLYVNSISKVEIPWLGASVDIWFDLEYQQNWFTERQMKIFEAFKSFSDLNRIDLRSELEKLYDYEQKQNRIQEIEFDDILKTINWEETQICIPQHKKSENNYVLFLPETTWKITDSDFCLELELLYTNGKIELCQEMSGLWCRTEWYEDYI